ncbi:MAG TPA: hypothetical protein VN376_10145 [Longilinea sp.]|nr:hypothetical protein [Longilinea sp.]
MKKLFNFRETPVIKRNIFLSILLSLIIIVNVCYFVILFLNIIGIASGPEMWMVFFSTAVCLGNVICALATWFWRRWGVIGYGVIALTTYIVNVLMTQEFTNVLGLAGSALVVILILPKWNQMI